MARQEGVLARHQALAGGLTQAQWDWKLNSGRWQGLLPGVAVNHTGEASSRQLAWAGCVHAGTHALLSGDAGLALRGFKGRLSSDIDVVVPAERRVAPALLSGGRAVRPHRSAVSPPRRTKYLDFPVADTQLTVLHAAAWAVDDRAAEWRVAAAVQQRLTVPTLLRSALVELPRIKRRALLATVVDDVDLGAHAGSELAYLRFCRTHDLPVPDALQVLVRVGGKRYLDARYTRQRVTVELDGAHHRSAGQWEKDTLRTLQLAVALPGEQVIRLSPANLRHDGPEVARLLRVLLSRFP